MDKIESVEEFVLWWRLEKAGTARSLARAMQVTYATLYYWLREERLPIKHWKLAEKVSEGKFQPQELWGEGKPLYRKRGNGSI